MRFIRIYILLFLILVNSIILFGQQFARIDSLRSLLPRVNKRQQFDLLNDIGFAYRLSYPDSTIWYCTRAFEVGQELNLQKDLSKPLSFIGLAKAYKGDYKSSFDFHTRAIEVAQQQSDSLQLAFCYNNFGRLFFDQGDYARAYENLFRALQIFEVIQDPSGLAYLYRSLSNIHKSQCDFEKALDMSLKAVNLRKKVGEPRTLLSSLSELGLVYSELKKVNEANRCFEQADSIAQRIEDYISLAEIRIGWAEFLIKSGAYEKADSLARLAYSMVLKTNNVRLMPRANLLIGNVHYQLKDYAGAIPYLRQVIDLKSDVHLDLKRDANFFLAKIYEQTGKKEEATPYLNQYLVLKEKLLNVDLAREIEKLQFQLEIEKKERENEQLKARASQHESVIRQQRLQNIILYGIVISVTLLLFMQWRNTKKRKEISERLMLQNAAIESQRKEIIRQNEQLERHNRELSDLNHEKDTLMNIVAHDLKSPLNRIRGLSSLVEMEGSLTGAQKKYLDLIADSTRAGLDLITDLLDVNSLDVNREPDFAPFNIDQLVNDRVTAFSHTATGKSIKLVKTGSAGEIISDYDYVTRIFDNLLSNAIKFSPAQSTVTISLAEEHHGVMLSVKDQGPGFSEEDKKFLYQKFKKLSARPTGGESSNGLGLAIVKILLDRLKGEITLNTYPNQGSEFIVRLPKNSSYS
ncbi:MAG: tetratricopeptide repeat protein [Cyclobacteriaceae bacterium]